MMLRQFIFIFLLSVITFVANAEDEIRYYNVEVVLFEHTNPTNHQAENWSQPKQTNFQEQEEKVHQLGQTYIMEAESPYDPKLMFTPIPKKEYQLLEEAKKIHGSSNRRILMHTAWRQPGLSREQAIRVHFKQVIENFSHIPTEAGNRQVDSTSSLAPAVTSKPYLEGSIKVMLSRYLHVDTDIIYFTMSPETGRSTGVETGLESASRTDYDENRFQFIAYQMKQLRRRIRSKELHYLDHPVLGMLLIITPYEKPKDAENTNTAPMGYRTLSR